MLGTGEEHDNRRSDGPPQKRARDEKYAIPTMEEASLLRETEGKLFEGNLLRLEVEELLTEVRVDHGKKSVKALEVCVTHRGREQGGTACPTRKCRQQGFPSLNQAVNADNPAGQLGPYIDCGVVAGFWFVRLQFSVVEDVDVFLSAMASPACVTAVDAPSLGEDAACTHALHVPLLCIPSLLAAFPEH